MGGKGIRRREKNYKAAHGGASLLPPPPKASSVDALPSKLRQLIAFTSARVSNDDASKRNKKNVKRLNLADEKKPIADENKDIGGVVLDEDEEFDEEKFIEGQNLDHDNSSDKKKKKKRKKNQVNDRRFEEETVKLLGIGSKRKERKKKYLEEKKKKKKAKIDDNQNHELHRHEKIAFGDVVQAPPKLATVPKAIKSTIDASRERLRVKAVDAYRQRKGWASRPGINLPGPVTTTPLI